jgi:hypothetical protein
MSTSRDGATLFRLYHHPIGSPFRQKQQRSRIIPFGIIRIPVENTSRGASTSSAVICDIKIVISATWRPHEPLDFVDIKSPSGAMMHQPPQHQSLFAMRLSILLSLVSLAGSAFAAFGVTESNNHYVVDTNGGLVFTVNKATGDIISLKYNSKECQDSSKFSHISSGLGSSNVVATTIGTNVIKITVTTDTLVHYYIAKVGFLLVISSIMLISRSQELPLYSWAPTSPPSPPSVNFVLSAVSAKPLFPMV